MKGLIAFIVLVILPLIFWIEGPGYNMAKEGHIWIAFVFAPVSAAIFAYLVSQKSKGKVVGKPGSVVTSDDQGQPLLSRFWAVFGIVTVIQLIIAFILKSEI